MCVFFYLLFRCSCFFSCIVSFRDITYVCAKCMANKAIEILSAEERKERRHRRNLTTLRHYSKVQFDTLVGDRLKPRKCSKVPMAVQTERKGGGEGGSRARRKDLRLVNQPTPPRFRFIIMKYSTPFLFNITFTL